MIRRMSGLGASLVDAKKPTATDATVATAINFHLRKSASSEPSREREGVNYEHGARDIDEDDL